MSRTPLRLVLSSVVALALLGCSTDDTDDSASDSTETTLDRAEALADSPVAGDDPITADGTNLSAVREAWEDAGASPELAECYRRALADAGVGDVDDLDALVDAQESLTEDAVRQLERCVLAEAEE